MPNHKLGRSILSGGLFIILVAFALLAAGQEVKPPLSEAASPVDCIYRDLTSDYPIVLSISPDGAALLLQTIDIKNGTFGLTVTNLAHETLRSIVYPTLPFRSRWSPDSKRISFFTPKLDAIGRELHIWDISTGEVKDVPMPFTAAEPDIKWSPDGEYLAYVSEEAHVNHVLIIVDAQTFKVTTVPSLRHVSLFSWAPDSKRLAVVIQDAPNKIDLIGMDGHVEQSFTVSPSLSLIDFLFSPTEDVLLLSSSEVEPGFRYILEELDWTTAKTRRLVSSNEEITSAMWTPDGKRILFQKTMADDHSLLSLERKTGIVTDTKAVSGLDSLVSIFPDGQSVAIIRRLRGHVGILMRVSLAKHSTETLYSHDASLLPMIHGETQWISSFDGMQIPIIVWKPAKYRTPRAAVVLCHGGVGEHEPNAFRPTSEWFLKQGIPVVAVNFRGSNGYGKKFERSGDFISQVRDVLSAIEYTHKTLDVPYERIVLLGRSLGANYAAVAGRMEPHHVGVVVLASLNRVAPQFLGGIPLAHPGKIILVHGTYDNRISLPMMLKFLVDALGAEAAEASVLRLVEVPDEHVYNSMRSWASTYAVLSEELGLSPKDVCGLPADSTKP